MKKLIRRIIIAIGFFTVIPVPFIKWKDDDTKYLPLFIPLIGMIIGTIFYGLLFMIEQVEMSAFLNATIVVIFMAYITGGLHMDAFMDTCDAHFSRRDKEQKLIIMKDSNIGAFAALYLVLLILFKVAIVNELFINNYITVIVITIPVISRIYHSLLLLNTRFAKEDSLMNMYGKLSKKYQLIYLLYILMTFGFGYISGELLLVFGLHIMAIGYLIIYRRFALKQFGGITGDVIGAYIEIVEVLLLVGVLLYGTIYWG